ncbi:protein crossbronx-like [Drosophila kikkawai]|uniref:Protein crossbronx-like n=1 Tax=Drosophila kikkawai TaxID=30033 RepID=A0A6P4JLP3_DROKI|nr:protein crossbronx-like [Drosophila kikkawai]
MKLTVIKSKGMALITLGYHILAEYHLVQEQLKNIYAIPSFNNGLRWFGVLFVHSGIYAGSVFRFSILLPENFPDDTALPTVVFSMPILHPHICPQSKVLDLTPGFKKWNRDQHHIWHLLRYIQAIFADPESILIEGPQLDVVLNMEALDMLTNNRLEYLQLAQEQAISSQGHMYDRPETDDPHYIVMEPYRADRHLKFMKELDSASWWEATRIDSSMPAEYLGQIEDTTRELDEEEGSQRVKSLNGAK